MADPMTEPSDTELIESAKSGDRNAMAAIVTRYENRVYRLAIKMVKNEPDAEDVLQETFITVIRKLDSFKGDSAFGTWLFRVATNQALMLLRKRGRLRERTKEMDTEDGLELPANTQDWSLNPTASLMHGETIREMDVAIARLPESLRSVFLLRDVEGLSAIETSEVLEITIPAIKSRLHRARMQLREDLADYFRPAKDKVAAPSERQEYSE